MLFDWRFKHENFLLQLRQTQLVDEHKRNLNAQNKRKMTSFKITRDPFLAYFECNRNFFLGINQVVKKKKDSRCLFCVCVSNFPVYEKETFSVTSVHLHFRF